MSGSWLNISTPLTPYIYHSIIVIMIIKNNFNSLVPRLTFFSSSPFLFSRAFRNSVMNCSLCCFLQSDTHVHNYMYTCVYMYRQTDRQTQTHTWTVSAYLLVESWTSSLKMSEDRGVLKRPLLVLLRQDTVPHYPDNKEHIYKMQCEARDVIVDAVWKRKGKRTSSTVACWIVGSRHFSIEYLLFPW